MTAGVKDCWMEQHSKWAAMALGHRAPLCNGHTDGIQRAGIGLRRLLRRNFRQFRRQCANHNRLAVTSGAQLQLRGFLQAHRKEDSAIVAPQLLQRNVAAHHAIGSQLDSQPENIA